MEIKVKFDKWDIEEIKEKLVSRMTNREIFNVLREVAKEKLTDEIINKVIDKAIEKAIKDLSRGKLIRDYIELDIKVQRIWKTLEKRGVEIENY